MEPRTYTKMTKQILLEINAGIRELTLFTKQPSEEQAVDYSKVKTQMEDIAKCVEGLNKLYEIPETGITKIPPKISLELTHGKKMEIPEAEAKEEEHVADIATRSGLKSLLTKYAQYARDELEIQRRFLEKCKKIIPQVEHNEEMKE